MDAFFGLDSPALREEGLSLLVTLYDDVAVQIHEAILRDAGIPYLKKDRSGGTAIRLLTGNNPHGTDIYTPEAYLAEAHALLACDAEADETIEGEGAES